MRIVCFPFVIAAALGPVSGQTVWTVGPNAQFQQLQPAIDAAAAGDIIEVAMDLYQPAEMSKGLSILAEPGTQIAPNFSFAVSLHVHDVPANERVTITNLVLGPGPMTELLIEDCAGPVHIEDVSSIGIPVFLGSVLPGLEVRRCPHVTMARVRLVARGTTTIEDSTVAASDCVFDGADEPGPAHGLFYGASPGLRILNASVELSRCAVSGGDGLLSYSMPGAPAVQCTGGSLVIGGIAGTTMVGGLGASGQVGSLVGTGSAVVDPVVTLEPAPTLPTTFRPLPSLSISAAVRGGTIQGQLAAEAGHSYAVFVGVPTTPVATPFGTVWFAVQPLVIVRSGVVGSSGVVAWSLPVLPGAALEGGVLTWQAFATTSAGLHLSNPVEQVIQ